MHQTHICTFRCKMCAQVGGQCPPIGTRQLLLYMYIGYQLIAALLFIPYIEEEIAHLFKTPALSPHPIHLPEIIISLYTESHIHRTHSTQKHKVNDEIIG